jgi:hypothetical protein
MTGTYRYTNTRYSDYRAPTPTFTLTPIPTLIHHPILRIADVVIAGLSRPWRSLIDFAKCNESIHCFLNIVSIDWFATVHLRSALVGYLGSWCKLWRQWSRLRPTTSLWLLQWKSVIDSSLISPCQVCVAIVCYNQAQEIGEHQELVW